MQPSLLSYLRKLRNHEFAEAYELISSNLEIEELEGNHLNQAVKSVQDFAPQLVHLKNLVRQHPITQQMDDLKKERHQYLLSLRGRVAYCRKSPTAMECNAANRLHVWMLGYHEFFKGATIHTQSRLTTNMSNEIQSEADLSAAIDDLGLISTMDTIIAITNQMRELHLMRLKHNKEAAALAERIREIAFAHIVTLWKTLEVCVALKTHDGVLCRGLFESINWVIIDFKARFLGKATRRENEKLKADQPQPETDPEPETT